MKRRFFNCSSLLFVSLVLISCDSQKDSGVGDSGSTHQSERDKDSALVESLARELAARGYLDNGAAEKLQPLIRNLAAKTRFGSQLHVNDGFSSNCLNVFIVKPHACSLTDGVCAYAGANTIFCDSGFLNLYLQDEGILKGANDQERTQMIKCFQTWVLGHEISHADLKHSPAHFEFVYHPRTQPEAMARQKMEFEADRRFVEIAQRDDIQGLEQLLSRIFNNAYRRKYGITDSTNQWLRFDDEFGLIYPYNLNGSHPDWTVRCARLLYIGSTSPEAKLEAFRFLQLSGAPDIQATMFNSSSNSAAATH